MKSKIVKIIMYVIVAIVLVIAGLLTYVKVMLPDVGPAPDITVEITPERVAHGEYLANHVALCMDCHAQRDFSLFSGPPIAGTEGAGGEVFDQNMGFPGKFVSRNITPAGLGDWTDGEIYRAVTCGVSKDGSALFPVMPYPNFGQLDTEDVYSIIAYIRSLKPIDRANDASVADFPMNFILNTIPKKAEGGKRPQESNKVEYGKYMITMASCSECHTKQEKGKIVGEPFAGGMEFKAPNGMIMRSANITPDETGIGSMSEDEFVHRFKQYADSSYVPHKLGEGDFQTAMPWMMYAGMHEDDLRAIYAYLRTVEPVENVVVKFVPPPGA